uniref:Ig-like domain-containing protein n=1 Tax=Zosterops lateralis melanops TaxID=1220523 RepID=A0A8D2QSH2_ZOSLA
MFWGYPRAPWVGWGHCATLGTGWGYPRPHQDFVPSLFHPTEIVPKPHVTATTNGDPQHCNATLNCSVSLPEVTYEWIPPQKLRGEAGPVLRVTPSPDGDTYVCRVTNPVSSSNASLTYRHPCTWTGESSFSSVTCATPSVLLALGNLIVLILLLTVA